MRIDTAEFIRSAAGSRELISDDRPQVAFAGRSNVGKSSLLNALLGRKKLARVSSTPGRTRVVNYFLINGRFYFVDLPGYGWARASKDDRRAWAELVEVYLGDAADRLLAVLLVDAEVGATERDIEAASYLRAAAPLVVVATKADRIPRGRRRAALGGIAGALELGADTAPVAVSARTGEGLRELWSTLSLHLHAHPPTRMRASL